MKKTLSLSTLLFLFIACGGGGIEGFVGEAISIPQIIPMKQRMWIIHGS